MSNPKWIVQYDCKQMHSRLYELIFGFHWGSYRESGMTQDQFDKQSERWKRLIKDGRIKSFRATCSDGRTIGGEA